MNEPKCPVCDPCIYSEAYIQTFQFCEKHKHCLDLQRQRQIALEELTAQAQEMGLYNTNGPTVDPKFPFGPIPHWIKCSERYPTEIGTYWCAYEATELSKRCCSFCYWLGDAWEGKICDAAPTWWFQLPEAPNE